MTLRARCVSVAVVLVVGCGRPVESNADAALLDAGSELDAGRDAGDRIDGGSTGLDAAVPEKRSSGPPSLDPPKAWATSHLEGHALGFSGGEVAAYSLTLDGGRRAQLASASLDFTGDFTLELAPPPSGNDIIEVSCRGTVVSLADDAGVQVDALSAWVPGQPPGRIEVNWLTQLATEFSRRALTLGTPVLEATLQGQVNVMGSYGLAMPAQLVVPTHRLYSPGEKTALTRIARSAMAYGLVEVYDGLTSADAAFFAAAALDECARRSFPSQRAAFLEALAVDFSDGAFDGHLAAADAGAGQAILVGTTPLSITAGSTDYLYCVTAAVARW